MAATAVELMESRQTIAGKSGSHEKQYSITGSSSEAAALAALRAAIADTYVTAFGQVMILKTLEVDPVFINTDNDAGCTWKGIARYAPDDEGSASAIPESQFSFDTAGGTVHITQSKETMGGAAIGAAVIENYEQAIGVERDDSGTTTINGVDINQAQFQFRETHFFTDAEVTQAYKITIADLTNKTNDDEFRGFEIGEVLFLGASGQRNGDDVDDLWSITFSFAVQRNRTDVEISPNLTFAAVGGWEYVWCVYSTKEDTAAGTTIRRPTLAYRERVYDAGDFATLGIGEGS